MLRTADRRKRNSREALASALKGKTDIHQEKEGSGDDEKRKIQEKKKLSRDNEGGKHLQREKDVVKGKQRT